MQVEFRDSQLAEYIRSEAKRTGESQESIKRQLFNLGAESRMTGNEKKRGR